MPRESAIVEAIVKWINSQPRAIARKRHGTAWGMAGEPDVNACVRGRSVQIEVKQPGEKPSALQLRRLEEWQRAGALSFSATSLAEVKQQIEPLLRSKE